MVRTQCVKKFFYYFKIKFDKTHMGLAYSLCVPTMVYVYGMFFLLIKFCFVNLATCICNISGFTLKYLDIK